MRDVATSERGKHWFEKLEPLAAVLLALGLAFAVVMDGALPAAGTKALFGVLVVLDLVMIHWLIRSRSS